MIKTQLSKIAKHRFCLTGNEESGILPNNKKYYNKQTPMTFRKVKVKKGVVFKRGLRIMNLC